MPNRVFPTFHLLLNALFGSSSHSPSIANFKSCESKRQLPLPFLLSRKTYKIYLNHRGQQATDVVPSLDLKKISITGMVGTSVISNMSRCLRDLGAWTAYGANEEEGHKDDQRKGAYLLSGQAGSAGVVQPGEDSSLRPFSTKRGPREGIERDFLQGFVVIEMALN